MLAAALLAAPAMAQDTLTLGTAVRMALEQELGVRIAANSALAAEELATPGNAGLLPRIDATAQGSYNNNYSRLDFAEGIPDVERSGVESTSWGATLQAAWTVFNGNG
ncbi:MAG: TolC family protein, partial [Flavobacteriales bacterium]|nr:TolC family protein [Flavobacteriales bacterium]